MIKSCLGIVNDYLESNKVVKFAYLFGSCARGECGPLSDIDVAVYLDKRVDFFSARLRFLEQIDRLLKGHPFDLVILNNASLVLKYEVIHGGRVMKENKKRRIPFEIAVFREYLDTEPIRTVHMQKIKRSFSKGQNLGQ
ncbi:type VII toxin-antitoxin system MntA family adenylyltransferase antitoxin [Desulfocastanea catecholica]